MSDSDTRDMFRDDDRPSPTGRERVLAALDERPQQIGPYRILETIGQGGMGTVYKAEQRSPIVRVVALKLIRLGMDTREFIARFDGERQALAVMDHPHIARVFDAGASETGRPYFVMEYVPGVPITDYCDKYRLSTRQRLELFAQVCDAIQHAHTKGIIHRDLKPGNILVWVRDDQPVAKVIDFGIAKATTQKLTERTLFTETGQIIGTPEYMSPEQAEMGALDVDTRSDIYSLGVILYQLLSGTLPFDPKTLRGVSLAEIQRIIREVDPPRPSMRLSTLAAEQAEEVASRRQLATESMRAELRRELEWIPLKAMRKNRTQRYRSASEMADDIDNYLHDRPLIAGPDSLAYRARKAAHKHRAALAVAAAFVVTFVALTGWYIYSLRAEQRRTIAEKQRTETALAEARQQERKAVEQAAIARAVINFQTDMLGSADPNKMLGERVTVRDAIQAAVRELDAGKLKDQPLVEAAVRNTIGTTYRELDKFAEAEASLRKALDLCRANLPAGDADVVGTLTNLATVMQAQGKYAQSEALFREALPLAQQLRPPKLRELAAILQGLAASLRGQGKLADAEPLYVQALKIRRAQDPPQPLEVSLSLTGLGILLRERRHPEKAESVLREALQLTRDNLPAGHVNIATSLSNLALVVNDRGAPQEAEPLYREALEILRKAFPQGHSRVALVLNNLARVQRAQNRIDDAVATQREAVDVARKSLEPDHPLVARQMLSLGLLLQDQKHYDEAERLMRDALLINRKVYPAGHPEIVQNLKYLAALFADENKLSDSEAALREVLETTRASPTAGHAHVAMTMEELAAVLEAGGKFGEAEQLLREAGSIWHEQYGPQSHPGQVNAARLVDLLDKQGRYDDAAKLRKEFSLPATTTSDSR